MHNLKKFLKLNMMIIITIIFTSCTNSKLNIPVLSKNKTYNINNINIHSPNEDLWRLLKNEKSDIVFAKYGSNKEDTYIARVVMFELKNLNKNEFVKLIKNKLITNLDKKRYDLLKSDIKYYYKRKYPCVSSSVLLKDKFAKVRGGGTKELLLDIKSLHCKDPSKINKGFMIVYSFRSLKNDINFNKKANSFISGVEVSNY